ncbi:MAG: ShlB/FhaC/HecB family hemolysin secretion/activation protein [Polaromonas sp.]|nr:ShlB/FhaC/HecB family hemolysin secretion/activation protein [Polaromonas sp.]
MLPLALLTVAQYALAQQAPSAGSQLQQIPPVPIPPVIAPSLPVEPARPTPSLTTGEPKILVKSLLVTGASLYSQDELVALTGFVPGTELTLSDLRNMAHQITVHYRMQGYFVAEAYLPAQDVQDHVLTIAVREGRYGEVRLRNQSTLADPVAFGLLDGLNSGDAISISPLESRLLLLSDLPGVRVNSTLAPGAAAGTSDLLVDVTPGRMVTGSVDADNAGNRYTGEYRVGGTVNLNNLLGRGDVASLRGVTSGSGLKYLRASYQMQFGKARAGVAYSRLDYALGREFRSLQAHGSAKVFSLFGTYQLIRSRSSNLALQTSYDDKTFQDRVDSAPSVTDKKSRVLTVGLYGDHRDRVGGGGLNTYGLSLSAGHLDIQTPGVLAADAATAKTSGGFGRLSFNASRLQQVGGPFSVYAGINGQLASNNLDVSEKMGLGGMNAVRGYPEGEGYGDQGYIASVEARALLPTGSIGIPGQMQAIAFVDTGSVTRNKNPWAAGPNTRSLSAAGIGLTWAVSSSFFARTYYAQAIGNSPSTSAPHRSGRFWIQLVKYL